MAPDQYNPWDFRRWLKAAPLPSTPFGLLGFKVHTTSERAKATWHGPALFIDPESEETPPALQDLVLVE